jgi:hypothetical protein
VQKYGMMARLEEMISYDDMKETVGAIQKLAADEPRPRELLEQSLQKKELVDEASTKSCASGRTCWKKFWRSTWTTSEIARCKQASFRSIAIGVWRNAVRGLSSLPREFRFLRGYPRRRDQVAVTLQ